MARCGRCPFLAQSGKHLLAASISGFDPQQSFTPRGGERQGAAWLGIEASPDCDILHNCRSAEFTNGCGCPNTRGQAQAWRDRTVSMS
jgi:hypothetical protein